MSVRTLHHHPLLPACRKVRLLLAEKDLAFTLELEKPWERQPELMALSIGGDLPVLVEKDGFKITDANAICEYIHEKKAAPDLLGAEVTIRAEVRALTGFFDRIFYQDVMLTLVAEKALKRLQGLGTPDGVTIRQGYAALEAHLHHISWLAEQHNWLAGDYLSLADLSAAAHISILDYLGDIAWEKYPEAKNWYARIKSRPSFRPLLADNIPSLPPPSHYTNLDF